MNPKEQLNQMVGKETADKWINIVKAIMEKEQPVNQTVVAQPLMEG